MANKNFSVKVPEAGETLRYAPGFSFVSSSLSGIYDPNAIVTTRTNIEIAVDYPLGRPAVFVVRTKSKKGFTRRAMVAAIRKLYLNIYKHDKYYQIWGHDIDDLCLAGFSISSKNIVRLFVDS